MNSCDILVEIGKKAKENLFNKDKLYLSDECNNHNSEYVDNTLSNRFENEVLTMNCAILRENWFDVSNPQSQIINGKSVVDIKHTNFLDEEFLLLEADDNFDDFEFERVFIASSNTSAVTVSNGYPSASHELPVTVTIGTSTSIAPHAMSLNMAETLVHCPPRSHTPSQAVSSMEKSKVKTESLWYPFSHIDNSDDIITLRELNGVSPASTPISTPSSTSDSTKSRSDFLKNLLRKSSSTGPSCALKKSKEASTRNDTSRHTTKSRDAPLVDISDANSLTEHRSNITNQNGNFTGEPLKLSSNVEHKHKTKPIIHSEEEEIAFLRSLGWEKNSEEDYDDGGLTLEEVLDFYDKHAKNCSYDQIFSKLCIKT
ncbi:unnamed protein product [Trifolium pratense]|uniref:Uncharacterized protein n=1 Tax=Trifolium pratense TaxID=57577 RepID=A0ACB0M7Z6_TRIPR|nr:unnamed protein product [Trifolium pratense]